jgi:hypothetical protein
MPNLTIDRIAIRTAAKISTHLDGMISALPEDAAPQLAIELVVRELAKRQPLLMSLIMEDSVIREAYAAAVAEIPGGNPVAI